jgi:sortase A
MRGQDRRLEVIGGLLIATGIIIVLAVGAWFVSQQLRGQQLRAQLQQTPNATPAAPAVSTQAPTATALPPTATAPAPTAPAPTAPAPTLLPQPTATLRPTDAAPVPAQAAATSSPASTVAPASSPMPTVRPRPIVPTPTASPEAPVRLVIPDLNIDAKVVEMGWEVINTSAGPQSDWVIPKNAAGHHINSATLDQPGNLVISGHNNIDGKVFEAISMAWDDASRARVDEFTDRSDILKGRQIRLFSALGRPVDYTITDFFRLRDSGVTLAQRIQNARFMEPTDDSQLTLVTCWPPWSNTHRLVVIAKPVQP